MQVRTSTEQLLEAFGGDGMRGIIYKRAAERMDKFIAVHSHLQLWWDWWQKCKSYVFCAFKPLYNVPKANHAEKSIHDGLRWVQGTWPW